MLQNIWENMNIDQVVQNIFEEYVILMLDTHL